MKIKKEVVDEVNNQLDDILSKMDEEELKAQETLEDICPHYQKSARNLIHYFAFRSFDVRRIQKHLRNLGLTRFANAEGHIKSSVLLIRYILGLVRGEDQKNVLKKHRSIKQSKKLLAKNTKNLLGYRSKGRRVRIMVTQPKESAWDYEMVKAMVIHGMNCARINCAHDSNEVWSNIIHNIRKASIELDKSVKISMDLAGPKIRTGKIELGPKVIRCKPEKNEYGVVTHPTSIVFADKTFPLEDKNFIPIVFENFGGLKVGQVLTVVDARGKSRKLEITEVNDRFFIAKSWQTIYFEPGLYLIGSDADVVQIEIGDIAAKEQAILLRYGDIIWVKMDNVVGSPAEFDELGRTLKPAFISCQFPSVLKYIKLNDRIFFDDGKIGGIITEIREKEFKVEINQVKEKGSKLRAYKGINFPDSKLGISGLTQKDREDLPFIVENADVINFSFVNRPEDVKDLYQELEKLNAFGKIGVILKIETKLGFENLLPILLEAMKMGNIGVMIARGDLAIETGWENIGKIQKEILSLCGAAHIPVIWATQVLENLAKTGLPSRSEITDATTALRAECVMLNKGPYINEAITLLNAILTKMETSQNKQESMLPKIETSLVSD